MTKTDDILMIALQQGDVDAFGELYARHHRPLSRWATKRFKFSIEDGEEIASRGLLSAYNARSVFSPALGSFQSWLYRITERAALTLLRERARIAPVELNDEAVESSCEQGCAKFRFDDGTRENLLSVSKLLAQLPPEQREAVRLLILEELSGRQAAELANVPEGTLASRLHKAKAKLRSWLNSRPPRDGSGGTAAGGPYRGGIMKSNKAKAARANQFLEDVRPDVLDQLTLETRTDTELFALLAIMEKQQRHFSAAACRRLGKSWWSALAPLRYRAGWLCAAVSGMLFITATAVAYNEYSINGELRSRVTALELGIATQTRTRSNPALKVDFLPTSDPAKQSCIPIRVDDRQFMLFAAPTSTAKSAVETVKKLASACLASQTAELQMSEP